MFGNNVLGIIFAYAHEERVRDLTELRVMASVPFGGRYRLVDFTLSNMVNSGLNKVGIITEDNYQSLMDHLGSGKAWDLSRKREGLYLLPPFSKSTSRTDGKIESLDSIRRFLKNSLEEYVILSDCDMVCNIDYREALEQHVRQNADITVIYRHGTSPDVDRNNIYMVDPENRIRELLLHRGSEHGVNYGIGMYILSRELLLQLVEGCMSRNEYDFDKDMVQRVIPELRVMGYEFKGIAYQIFSFEAYFNANMGLMDPRVRAELFNPNRPIYTKVRDDMPAKYGLNSYATNCLVADGCVIDGEVENCVLFRGVKIGKGAKVRNCVIMQDTVIGANSRLDYVVADKNVEIEENRTLMGYQTYPVYIAKESKV